MIKEIRDFISSINRDELINVYLPVTIGSIILAIGQNLFTVTGGLLASGFMGLSLILDYSIGIPAGIGYFILNIPMVILAIRKLSLKFTLQSFYAVIIFSIAQLLTVGLVGQIILKDTLLYAVFGGIIRGAGAGLIYRVGVSSLGTDVISTLIRRNFNINIGTTNMAIDLIIMLISSYLYGIDVAFYTIISLYITVKISDSIMLGVGERKNVMIVTKEYEKISREIMEKIGRGVTLLDATGAYTGAEMKMIFTVCTKREIVKVRQILDECDEHCFMTITDTHQVKGEGFRNLGS